MRAVETVALGLALGLGAGVSPGPLLAVLLVATVERGFLAGARVACVPLITDAPIVVLCVLVLRELPSGPLAALSLAGAAFLAYLAVEAVRGDAEAAASQSDVRRGVLVNALSPHPWLFWSTVGGPLLVDAAERSPALAAGFAAAFYLVLVGAKVAIAALVAAGRRAAWVRAARPLSAAMFGVAAIALLVDGLGRL